MINFALKAFLALIFLSKVSFKGLGFIPDRLDPLIFQYGLHPFANAFLSLLFSGMILFGGRALSKSQWKRRWSFDVFIKGTLILLPLLTLLQYFFVQEVSENGFLSLATLVSTMVMIWVFGSEIPQKASFEFLEVQLRRWTVWLTVISLILLPIFSAEFFKGGRFIGVFKHIPHMVTCATVASIFQFQKVLKSQELFDRLFQIGLLLLCVVAVYMTGTRSSLVAVLVAWNMMILLHRSRSWKSQYIKGFFILFSLVAVILFGPVLLDYSINVATGKQSLGDRQAQDGVSSRWEEVERGWDYFQESELLGHGLVAKFAADGEASVANYNSFKDPHNIFVSAATTGGWSFMIIIGFGILAVGLCALKALRSSSASQVLFAIYLLSHWPILIIYHVHLSMGGMADRIYWLVFGVVGVTLIGKKREI